MAKRQRPADLPGMEDRAIVPLQEAALKYAEIRDERMALNQREAQLKAEVRTLMKRHRKTHYAYDGVEIDILPPEADEIVKVRVRKPKDGPEESIE
jgi:hypothetical protein